MSAPLPAWQITGMTPTTKLMPGANPTEGYDFHFEASNGVNGSVFIPTAQIGDTDTVATIIRDRIAQLTVIRNLSG